MHIGPTGQNLMRTILMVSVTDECDALECEASTLSHHYFEAYGYFLRSWLFNRLTWNIL
jgi:hypothetical protein